MCAAEEGGRARVRKGLGREGKSEMPRQMNAEEVNKRVREE